MSPHEAEIDISNLGFSFADNRTRIVGGANEGLGGKGDEGN